VRNCPTTDQSKSKEVGFQYIERIPRHQSKGGDFSFLNAGLAERLPGQASLGGCSFQFGPTSMCLSPWFFPPDQFSGSAAGGGLISDGELFLAAILFNRAV
jgi:hypothetical protein